MSESLVCLLVEADPVPALLNRGQDWRRVYGRTTPNGATLVYEPEAGARDAAVVSIGHPWTDLTIRRWSDDPALPGLATLVARHPDLVPVRYRPGKRCVLSGRGLYLKCIADDRGMAINRESRLIHEAARSGHFAFGVARPAGWMARLKIVAHHRVEGRPITQRLGSAEGPELAERLGLANASLAAAPLRPGTRFTYADQMARTTGNAQRMATVFPELCQMLDRLLVALANQRPGAADRPIHGAPHANQWLDGTAGLMLVDFDRFAYGDPELDAATYMAEADFEAKDEAKATADSYRAGFETCWPLDPGLLRAYRVHKHVAKALRTATAIRLDARARAQTILAGALDLLERAP